MTLPKKIYVKEEKDGQEKYLVAGTKPKDLVLDNVSLLAGEYILKRKVKISTTIIVEEN